MAIAASLSAALFAATLIAMTSPALAAGGRGGNGPISSGGTGGSGPFEGTNAGTGGNGGDGNTNNGGAGGGGGGAGGGAGGHGGAGLDTSTSTMGPGGTGGPGGTTAGAAGGDGQDGSASINGGAGGGGGGAHGFTGASLPGGSLTGGAGGNGGTAQYPASNGGGGGGAGGYGAYITGGGVNTNTGTIRGGNGGHGGDAGGFGGSGGDGGIGIYLATAATLINTGSIIGGNGGAPGCSCASFNIFGAPGTGGAGVAGRDLTIINSGSISGGMSSDGIQAAAILFTGGVNVLELRAGSNISGNVAAFSAADTLRLGGSTSASFDVSGIGTKYQNFGQFAKTGSGTWTLTGTTTAVTPWSISQGALRVSADAALGAVSGGLTLTGGGTLQWGGSFNSARAVTLGSGGGVFDTQANSATWSGVIQGGGSLTKLGSGTLTLAGTNTYSGGTTISNGTLQVGDGGTSGAITGNVVNNGRLIFNRSDDTAFAGAISGNGLFTKNGTGTLTLSGNNTYTGGTQLLGGTLAVQGGNAIGDNSSVIVLGGSTLRLLSSETVATLSSGATNFGTVELAGGNLTTSLNSTITTALYYGGISGAGGLIKTGTYRQVLAGNNTYTGGTTIQAGTLQLGDTTQTGSLIGSVLNNATFEIVNADTSGLAAITNNSKVNFRNSTSAGTAPLTTAAGGQTAFFGNSTAGNARLVTEAGGVVDFSASAGPAGDGRLSAGSIEGAGLYSLGANALTVGGNNLSTIVSGVIADGGASGGTGASLTKTGSGTLTLNGANTYTGMTTVDAGKLVVGDDGHAGASLASAVTVNSGGTLGGIGTVGGLTMNAGGTVAPGNSIGTLNVTGNISFAPGSFYQVEANAAGQSDKIVATGTATLGGGSVLALAQAGTYAPQTTYTIVTANGGVSGTFADVTSSLTFLTPALTYDLNNVYLTLSRNDIQLTNVAQTPNQRAVAGALQVSSLTAPLVVSILNQTAAGARQAFDALSGEVHASAQTAMLDDARYLRDAVMGRLRQSSFAGDTGPMAALGMGGPDVAAMESLATSSALAYAGTRRSSFPIKAPPPASPARISDTAFWAQGVGAWGRFGGDGNAAGMKRDLAGFFSGVDHRFAPNWIAGIAGGYTNSSVRVGDRSSSANIDTAHLAGYVGATYGALSLRGGAGASFSTLDTSRSVIFPNFVDSTRARYNATTAQVFGEVGYGFNLGQIALEPFAGLAWAHLGTNSFNETGGAAALLGSSNNQDVGYTSLGARFATNVVLSNGMWLTPRATVAWQHAFGDVTPTAALAFRGLGTAFTTAGVPLARNAALVEGGLDLRVTSQASVGVSYVGQIADRVQDHSVKGNFSWKF